MVCSKSFGDVFPEGNTLLFGCLSHGHKVSVDFSSSLRTSSEYYFSKQYEWPNILLCLIIVGRNFRFIKKM